MFYSHQLLARKAPLGQIWMAATMHGKINRKNLYKLNLIRICEEILNPSIPMALRLSGILMGGVVIVYERKVKLLYDDVTRLLVEINQAWKIKAVSEPSNVSKSKTRTKREAITRSGNGEENLEEIEQPLPHSNTMDFKQTTYFAMRLDNLEDPINNQVHLEDPQQDNHQVDADNITLFDSYQPDTNVYNHFERFDIEGDNDTQMNFSTLENTDVLSTVIPSPPAQDRPQEPEEILEQHPEVRENQESDQSNKGLQDHIRQGPTKKRARRHATTGLDYEHIIIPGHVYQSWLQNTSDIISRRRKRTHLNSMPTRKISNLMELPPVVLAERLFKNGTGEIHYPDQLLELWMRSTEPPHNLPSGRDTTPPPPVTSSSSPEARVNVQVPIENPFEDIQSGDGSQFRGLSTEKLRANHTNNYIPPEILMEDLRNHSQHIDLPVPEDNGLNIKMANLMTTPGNSGDELRSIPSSGSGHGFGSHNSDVDSGRSNKKRAYSSSKHSGNGLEPVAEENPWKHQDSVFKLAKLAENGLTPENELLVETGPTQTQRYPIIPQPMDHISHSIKVQLKSHFDTPGCPQVESLNQLTYGMDRKRAACLFYTTCVLASQDCIRVAQKEPYGDILISRGSKM